MKRLMILCIGLLFFIPIQLNARKYFCEIKGTNKTLSAGLKIVFDFGESPVYSIWNGLKSQQKMVECNTSLDFL